MKNRIKILLPAALFMYSIAASAQTPQKISLQQAIDMSIKNSGKLAISSAKIIEATANVREAEDRRLPDVKATGSYLRLFGANVDLKKQGNSTGTGSAPKVNQALYGIVNASYPIYTGGRIRYGIESAKYLEQAARLSADNDKEGITYNTIQAYTNLYKAGAMVAVVEEARKASVQRDSLFSRLEQNGVLARNDLLKAELQTSNIELTLLDAQSNLTMANVNMDLILGLPENTIIGIDSNFVNGKQELKSFPDMEALALQNRKDVQAVGFQKKAADLGIKSAKAENYPSLALTGGYIAADIPKVVTITNAVNIGIGVQYNLSSLWKTNTKLQQAKARATELAATQSMMNDQIKLELNRDYQAYLLAQKKIEVYDKSVIQATENYRITKNKYDNSLVTITDLLDADVSLLQARLSAAAARADAALSYNKLLETTGTLSK